LFNPIPTLVEMFTVPPPLPVLLAVMFPTPKLLQATVNDPAFPDCAPTSIELVETSPPLIVTVPPVA